MTQEPRERLIALLVEKSVQFSDEPVFRLASGKMSNFYVDCRKVTHAAEGKYLIGNIIFAMLKDLDVQAIGGLTLGADPIANAVSYTAYLNKQMINSFVIRKERKEHGLKKLIEGDVEKGAKVVIVDDVITTGGSTIKAIDAARNEGLEIVKVIVLVDREEGGREEIEKYFSDVASIYTRTALLEAYKKARSIS
jgi:orotate phosphoribosyltransferase